MHTDYGLSIPSRDDIRKAFTTLQRAVEITGGDINLILLYIHNPDLIEKAPEVEHHPSEFAKSLRADAGAERRHLDRTEAGVRAAAAWSALEKPTVTAVADALGVAWHTARDYLVRAGKYTPAGC